MEAQLLDFVRQVTTMADVRNMDPRNPIAIDFDFPSMSMRYRVVGSITEPSAGAYPINVLWVVLDAESEFYQRVLQLKSITPNDEAFPDRVVDSRGPMLGTWVEIPTYAELFVIPQYYVSNSGGGQTGPAGKDGYVVRGNWNATTTYSKDHTVYHQGSSYASKADNNLGNEPGIAISPPGEPLEFADWILVAQKGDEAFVDYERIISEAVDRLSDREVALEWTEVPDEVWMQKPAALAVAIRKSTGVLVPVTNPDDWSIAMEPQIADFADDKSSFTSYAIGQDTNVRLTATLLRNSGDSAFTITHDVVIKARYPVSLTVNGPTSVNEGASAQYNAIVTYNDGSTRNVTTGLAVWSVTGSSSATIGAATGTLTTTTVSATTPIVVRAEYTENGRTVNGTRNVSLVHAAPVVFARYGAAAAVTNMSEYTSDFVNNVTNQLVAQSGLTNQFNLNLASGMYGYYAHPKSWGVARFEDLDAPGFYGAWDGAQNDIQDPAKWGPWEVNATVNGVTEPWLVYRTDHNGLGATRWSITPMP